MTTSNKTMRAVKQSAKQAASAPAKAAARTIKGALPGMRDQIALALPKMIDPDRFYRIVLTAVSNSPRLEECTFESFMGAMMQAAQLGLEPNTPLGQAYMIPFWNSRKRVYECQFQIGYHGMIALAMRSGEINEIRAETVFENDEFEYELGWDQRLVHRPALTGRGRPIAFYAVYKTKSGGGSFIVMSKEDVEAHAARFSQAFKKGNSPWQTDFESMAKKTCIKQLLKYAPINVELQREIAADETVKSLPAPGAVDVLDARDEFDFVIDEPEEADGADTGKSADEEPKQGAAESLAKELAGSEPFPGQESFTA